MATYEWEIEHRCEDEDELRSTLNDCRFIRDADDDYLYKREIRDWKNLKIRIKGERKLQVILHWMGDTTTETYFDYLVHSGMAIGKFITLLERKLNEQEELKLPPPGEEKEKEEEGGAKEDE